MSPPTSLPPSEVFPSTSAFTVLGRQPAPHAYVLAVPCGGYRCSACTAFQSWAQLHFFESARRHSFPQAPLSWRLSSLCIFHSRQCQVRVCLCFSQEVV